MKVSVIIPVYNRASMIRRAVTSVLKQTFDAAEVIVIDDGSEDDPSSTLSDINDDRLKVIKQKNKGVSAARNLGIEKSKSKWLAFLDSDDFWLPSKLEKQVLFHISNPRILISQTDEIWKRNGSIVNPKKYHQKQQGEIFEISLARCMISPSAVVLHRSLLKEVGQFDPNLEACEDYDLWLRICANHPVGLVSEKLVVKTGGHEDQLSQKHWGMDRFRVYALEKLLQQDSLDYGKQKAVVETLMEKLEILKNGAQKRGKKADAKHYDNLFNKYIQKRLEDEIAIYET
ncbi:MAG: glycosyltransferase [Actinobacteria bacterium]|nr:MAG: glycosyltransferase [Actinomycetota bacterium]